MSWPAGEVAGTCSPETLTVSSVIGSALGRSDGSSWFWTMTGNLKEQLVWFAGQLFALTSRSARFPDASRKDWLRRVSALDQLNWTPSCATCIHWRLSVLGVLKKTPARPDVLTMRHICTSPGFMLMTGFVCPLTEKSGPLSVAVMPP